MLLAAHGVEGDRCALEIEQREHAAKRVMPRDATFEPKDRPQPDEPIVAKPLDVRPGVRPGNRAGSPGIGT
jgi:hypothetical protein